MADTKIRAVITAQDDASAVLNNFGNTLKGTTSEAEKVTRSLGELTKAFVFGNVLYSVGANVVVKFKEGLNSLIEQANEAAKIQQQLNAVIESTGGVAGVTAKKANELADSIRNTTTVDNDAVLTAENMLLTFRDIGKNIFPTATKAVVDMATAMNGGLTPNADKLRATALQVGKALQDPILGVTTLRRVGVQLSDQQQQQVKDFIAVNDKADAQRVILNELSKEFGGSAAATADTFSGKLQQLKNRMDDFGKSVVLSIEGDLNRNLPHMESFANSVSKIASEVASFLQPAFANLVNVFETQLYPSLVKLNNALEPGLTEVLKAAGGLLGGLIIEALKTFIEFLTVAFTIISAVINIVSQLISWLGNLGGAFINLAKGIPSYLSGVVDAIEAPFKTAFNDIKAGITDVENAFNRVKNDITGAPGKAVSGVGGLLSHLPGFAGGTMSAPGGMAIVGENGPELVNLPKGSQVIPNNKMGSQTILNISINAGFFNGTDVEARKYAKTMIEHIKAIADSKNMPVGQLLGI